MLVNVFSHLVPTLGNGRKTKTNNRNKNTGKWWKTAKLQFTNNRKQILPFFYMTGGKIGKIMMFSWKICSGSLIPLFSLWKINRLALERNGLGAVGKYPEMEVDIQRGPQSQCYSNKRGNCFNILVFIIILIMMMMIVILANVSVLSKLVKFFHHINPTRQYQACVLSTHI